MSPSIAVLLGYTAWTMALVFVVVNYRMLPVLGGKTVANSWTRGGQTWADSPVITRIAHAHLNCLENLPLVAAVLLSAQALGQGAVTDAHNLPCVLLAARIGQSVVHIIAVNHWMVILRAVLYTVQMLILIWWLLKLAQWV